MSVFFWFVSVNALSFQNTKQIFGQRIVVAISVSWYKRRSAVFFSRVEIYVYACEVYLEPLVAVELQLLATFCFYRLHRKMNGIQYKIDCLADTDLMLLSYKSRIMDK